MWVNQSFSSNILQKLLRNRMTFFLLYATGIITGFSWSACRYFRCSSCKSWPTASNWSSLNANFTATFSRMWNARTSRAQEMFEKSFRVDLPQSLVKDIDATVRDRWAVYLNFCWHTDSTLVRRLSPTSCVSIALVVPHITSLISLLVSRHWMNFLENLQVLDQ